MTRSLARVPPRVRRAVGVALLASATLTGCTSFSSGEASVGASREGKAGEASAPASGPASAGGEATNEVFQIESQELAGNYLGASNEISVGVLLPAAYAESEEPLPVVYFLPGYTARNDPETMPDAIGEVLNAVEPMIVVTVVGANELGGGWYTDSAAVGNWEQAIVTEVVPYIDEHYRTIATRDARGLAGHSMGGYGAFTIGMKHPDVFGAVFALSPAIAGEEGIDQSALFGSAGRARTVLQSMESLEGLDGEELLDAMASSGSSFEYSYGTAVAPSPEPPYFRYPYTLVDGEPVRDPEVWDAWQAGFGDVDEEIAANRQGLLTLNGLGLDCGSADEYRWIFDGCSFVDAALTAEGVPHVYTVHEGTHTSRFAERLQVAMLPFFAEAFAGVRG